MKELPTDVKAFRRTPDFTEHTVPKGLLANHNTVAGVWGKIVVEEGSLVYTIEGAEPESVVLSPARFGVVEPTVLHHVAPAPGTRFYVEFYR